jgi:cobalt-zinc-cadmium efflux system protein
LILGVWLPGAVLICNLLLMVFFSTLVFNIARGLDIDCGCFTVSVGTSSGGKMLWYLFRDGFFLFVGLFLFFSSFFIKMEGDAR